MSRKEQLIETHSAKAGFRGRVDAMCIACIYDDGGDAGGTWRQQVEACTCQKCPLWPIRAKSSGVDNDE